ncbi:Bgt-1452 [Blumeria graminis f. sp. tritici]|uniref:Bgt-1452 n=2 Tax=Blumeria graminis f. sp. tritici TaxID=62690 RepID=A0A9X9QC76_BLUGR|nr:hypothetical protein BGT96224_1452 [Blumeria graminis f. sp. tritici 96224]VDB85653.1 Bgt-1452 [Blumeria graminis f. sp. tritici]
MSPDTIAPYLGRPIRPLPKRRLRERISPEVARLIKYPPVPKSRPPLFYHPYNLRDQIISNSLVELQQNDERGRLDVAEKNYISRRNGDDQSNTDEETKFKSWIFSRQTADLATRSYQYFQKLDASNKNSQPSGSTDSSADGYDSFENSNNKKKRKIPIPGDPTLNSARLTSDMIASAGPDDIEDLLLRSPSPSSVVTGCGRGKYGRNKNGRSPLRSLPDASNIWGNGRSGRSRQINWSPSPEAAGASRPPLNSNSDKDTVLFSQGQENMEILGKDCNKPKPTSTKFTFTCNPQIMGTVPWSGPNSPYATKQSQNSKRMSTHATQTSPGILSSHNNINSKENITNRHVNLNGQKKTLSQSNPQRRSRNVAGKEYLIAAQQRRHTQGYRNYQQPMASQEIWICEFCEYERIFGTPPEALIRQYEIKERRLKKQEAERRRLLEKAKMKGRKGKKGHKSAIKSTPVYDRQNNIQAHNVPNSPAETHSTQLHSLSAQSDDYPEGDHDDVIKHDPDLRKSQTQPTNFLRAHEASIDLNESKSLKEDLVVRLTVSQAVPRYIMLLEERPNVFLLIHEIFNVEFVTTDSNIS